MIYLYQHAHIENLKTVANLTNNKDIFMCIIRFHARAGYLQHYETLLKEINSHPGSDEVPLISMRWKLLLWLIVI